MARYRFAGGTADFIAVEQTVDGVAGVLVNAGSRRFVAWGSKEGADQLLDLQEPDGTPLVNGVIAAPDSFVPAFLGSDAVTALWLQAIDAVGASYGPRFEMGADQAARIADLEAQVAAIGDLSATVTALTQLVGDGYAAALDAATAYADEAAANVLATTVRTGTPGARIDIRPQFTQGPSEVPRGTVTLLGVVEPTAP